MNMEEKILQVPIEDIIPNRFQPRLTFDDDALQELAASIKEHGIIQPLVLRKLGDKYEIIAGERRYKASQIAGLTTVPAVISDIDDDKSAEVALVENIQRRNLTAIEEAKSYKNILDRGYLTQEQLAEKLGISQSTIANKMRLLNLCNEVQDALLKEKISERHARALLAIKDPTEQIKWLNKILNDRLTVRQLDIEIKKAQKGSDDDDDSDIPIVNLTPNIDEIKENALDINPTQGLHDIESMLKPSMPGEKEYNLNDTVEEVETLELDDEPTNTPSTPEKMPNKFFNFLEDEVANMDDNSSLDDLMNKSNDNTIENVQNNNIESMLSPDLNTNDNINEPEKIIEPNQNEEPSIGISSSTLDNDIINVQPLSDLNQNSSNYIQNFENNDNINQNIIEPVDNSNNNIIEEQPVTDLNDNNQADNSLFNFGMNNDSINNDNNDNNDIIEVKENVSEPIFDPMNMVNTLEPDYQEKQEEAQGIDLKTAIEKIRETKEQLESMGFNITIDEADTGDNYNITINIIK